jgi:5-methylcytosine-specific restriction endonuclease McrA
VGLRKLKNKWVRVLIGGGGRPVRIFRDRQWRDFPSGQVVEMTKAEAVKSIREQVFERSRNPLTGLYECEKCGRIITWDTGEMNERIPKGSGGEVSIANCEALCHGCHQVGPDSAHGDRRWQTAKGNYD